MKYFQLKENINYNNIQKTQINEYQPPTVTTVEIDNSQKFKDSLNEIFNNTKPYSVHRLDKDTSGVFIIAKNRQTAQLLTSLFRLRKVHKTYLDEH